MYFFPLLHGFSMCWNMLMKLYSPWWRVSLQEVSIKILSNLGDLGLVFESYRLFGLLETFHSVRVFMWEGLILCDR